MTNNHHQNLSLLPKPPTYTCLKILSQLTTSASLLTMTSFNS
ncbi:hypothetical protein GBAR_LOCUS22363 [Geodia barretti]|uniref:Uncharacterized protein n=1 Tax=Geodia barretti TaxID=519541 RepID=A0AA35T1P1_GEOBA|nr:hypothetical protein GBAR_LOCUS22363 [Geodia barretti]